MGERVKPIRIQRQRTKGWKMPPNTVYVGRTASAGTQRARNHGIGAFANPYHVGIFRGYTRADAVRDFKKWLNGDLSARVWAGPPPTRKQIRAELCGKNLACWCPLDQPCHADVLLDLANPNPNLQPERQGSHPRRNLSGKVVKQRWRLFR